MEDDFELSSDPSVSTLSSVGVTDCAPPHSVYAGLPHASALGKDATKRATFSPQSPGSVSPSSEHELLEWFVLIVVLLCL